MSGFPVPLQAQHFFLDMNSGACAVALLVEQFDKVVFQTHNFSTIRIAASRMLGIPVQMKQCLGCLGNRIRIYAEVIAEFGAVVIGHSWFCPERGDPLGLRHSLNLRPVV